MGSTVEKKQFFRFPRIMPKGFFYFTVTFRKTGLFSL